jgi:hypothetical protein
MSDAVDLCLSQYGLACAWLGPKPKSPWAILQHVDYGANRRVCSLSSMIILYYSFCV